MQIETGEGLVQCLRELGNGIKRRLWVAVPYIGSLKLIRQVLGKRWLELKGIDVRLITDFSRPENFDYDAIKSFKREGSIKTIAGLHAKVYILDDKVLVASANLTNTAFSKRLEIGIFLNGKEAQKVVTYYKRWWEKEAEDIRGLNRLRTVRKKDLYREVDELLMGQLKKRWTLPPDPGDPRRWFFVNTNRQADAAMRCEKDMIRHQKASAYYAGHKERIDSLKKGDIVFLYGNKSGIVAMGEVILGERGEKRPIHVRGERKKEEYFMKLSHFKKLKKSVSASVIKRICGRNFIFRSTLFSIDEKSGRKLKKEITRQYI